jgi:hypothetical protein
MFWPRNCSAEWPMQLGMSPCCVALVGCAGPSYTGTGGENYTVTAKPGNLVAGLIFHRRRKRAWTCCGSKASMIS